METEGWLHLVQRSVAFATKLSCQMVTQSHEVVANADMYGEGTEINKNAINHVSQRMGKALRDYVQPNIKKGEGVGGKKHGSLTQEVIEELQVFNNKR